MMSLKNILSSEVKTMTTNKWGGLASFLMAVSFVVAPSIYLTGNTRNTLGVFAYGLADFLSGPIVSASLITVTYVLREVIGKSAHRRMDLALLASVLSAAGMAAVAFIRASNRQYHLMHPELNLESSITVLTVWATLVTGMNAVGFHFMGWMYILLGSANGASRLFPRPLTGFYLLAGVASLFVYLLPELEGLALLLGIIINIWQGVVLWRFDYHTFTQQG
jgi:hypothetical protein